MNVRFNGFSVAFDVLIKISESYGPQISSLGPQDRYLLDAASGGTFMSKLKDKAMELIETRMLLETSMLLEKINKMAEV